MRNPVLVFAAVALGSIAATRAAHAQSSTIPSPFHAGQWGIEAYADVFGNGGVTRFFTPRTAFVLNVSADHIGTKAADETNASVRRNSRTTLDLSLGLRHHTMVAPRITSTIAGGITGEMSQQRIDYADALNTSSRYRSTYIGAFAEVGGQYMIADHFAVGLAYRFSGRHVSTNDGDQRGWELATAFLPVRASLYF